MDLHLLRPTPGVSARCGSASRGSIAVLRRARLVLGAGLIWVAMSTAGASGVGGGPLSANRIVVPEPSFSPVEDVPSPDTEARCMAVPEPSWAPEAFPGRGTARGTSCPR